MSITNILTALDAEINRLQQARKLLVSIETKPAPKQRKRTMSAAARKKIAEAQRRRWAQQKAQK